MSKEKNLRQLLAATTLGFVVAACSHNNSPSSQINAGLAPFSSTRTSALSIVSSAKRTLAADDVNTLSVAYTRLEEKANTYAGFMIEAVTTSSFDAAKNAQYSADFEKALATFNKTATALGSRKTVATDWVPGFAQSLQTRWDQYNGMVAKMTPQTKADLITGLKRDTVWPNYEDIATETVAGSP